MRSMHVRTRAALAATGIVFLATAFGSAGLVISQQKMLIRSLDASGQLRINDIQSSLADRVLPREITIIGDDSGFLQVLDSQGNIVSASKNIAGETAIILPPAFGSAKNGEVLENRVIGAFDNVTFRVIAKQISVNKKTYSVIVGYSLEKTRSSISYLIGLLIILNLLVMLLVYLATWCVTGRALKPVEKMRSEVDQLSAKDLSRRVSVPGSEDEIGRLGKTLNSMLDRLEISDQKQRRFVSDASHELRNPLAGMRTQLEVELLYPDPHKIEEGRKALLASTLRLQELTENLLVLAVSDSNKLVSNGGEIALGHVIWREIAGFVFAPGVTVDASEVQDISVWGDESQLRRVFINLLDNANRFAESMIVVSLAFKDEKVILEVIDDGPGIPMADQERIFERFSRLDDSRTRHQGGTGLGLAIAKEIVLAHDGEIGLLRDNKGAHFAVKLNPLEKSRQSFR